MLGANSQVSITQILGFNVYHKCGSTKSRLGARRNARFPLFEWLGRRTTIPSVPLLHR